MSTGALAGLITGATGLVTAVITLVKLLQHNKRSHKPAVIQLAPTPTSPSTPERTTP